MLQLIHMTMSLHCIKLTEVDLCNVFLGIDEDHKLLLDPKFTQDELQKFIQMYLKNYSMRNERVYIV